MRQLKVLELTTQTNFAMFELAVESCQPKKYTSACSLLWGEKFTTRCVLGCNCSNLYLLHREDAVRNGGDEEPSSRRGGERIRFKGTGGDRDERRDRDRGHNRSPRRDRERETKLDKDRDGRGDRRRDRDRDDREYRRDDGRDDHRDLGRSRQNCFTSTSSLCLPERHLTLHASGLSESGYSICKKHRLFVGKVMNAMCFAAGCAATGMTTGEGIAMADAKMTVAVATRAATGRGNATMAATGRTTTGHRAGAAGAMTPTEFQIGGTATEPMAALSVPPQQTLKHQLRWVTHLSHLNPYCTFMHARLTSAPHRCDNAALQPLCGANVLLCVHRCLS